jgi:glycine cleavage system H protein
MIEKAAFPRDRAYDRKHHMWAMRDADGLIRVGIDVLGLESLGDLAYVSLCATGTLVERGKAMGNLEAAKMTGDVFAPVSGRVVLRNDAAIADPRIVNEDPWTRGWLLAIEPSDWRKESELLLSGEALDAWVEAEIAHYRKQGWID